MFPVVGRLPFKRRTGAALALFSAVLLPARLEAQCTLTAPPVQFEPNPPGATRPLYGAPAGQLSAGFSNSLSLYANGSRILMSESFGYSTLDISNPLSPTAVRYDDLRYDPASSASNPIAANGDGQSYIQTLGVSADGQRVAFSVNGPAEPTWHTLVGRPDGANGFGIWGDFGNSRATGTVVQKIGARYIAYATYYSSPAIAADVTTLPTANSAFRSLNLASETTTLPAGYSPMLAGNYLVYMTSAGVQVVDASNPGPAGSITPGLKRALVATVPGDPSNRIPANFTAAVDPLDASKLWILIELAAAAGQNSPSYGLVSITKDASGNLLAPVAAGPLFRVPSAAGETWISAGGSASLVVSNFQLFALMWARRMVPTQQFVLYTTTASVWASPQATPVSAPNFNLAATSARALGVPGTMAIYQFLPTGQAAFVVPLLCQALDAKAVSVLSVTNAGAPVPDGGSAFFGDTLTITPTILPSPVLRPLSDWRFDFDFHAGAASEDAGPLPRLRNLDNAQFGSPPAPPPTATLVGPCDPRGGGVPASGAGCWASVLANAGSGGPDFTGAEPAGTQKPLTIALEGTNQYGIQNTGLFTVNWKVPGARLASTQVFAGLSLASASDGRPTGYRWYFGDTPTTLSRAAACDNLPTCIPTLGTRGTHYFWLTATYANGYSTPDYNGTSNVGQAYTVVDFSPVFAVNGSTSGVSVLTGANLTISNSSPHSPSISGTYFYSLCPIPSGQSTCSAPYVSLAGMTDPPTSGAPATYAALAAPLSAGNFLLRIRVDFTGGPGYWPDPAGIAGFPVTVTAPTPKLHIYVNGQDPCPPGPFCIEDSVRAKAGDTLTAYSYVSGYPDPGSVALSWSFPGATPVAAGGNGVTFSYDAAGTYDIMVTRNGTFYSFPGAAVIAPRPLPPTATASATPNPATFVDNVQLTCAASGGTGSYTYTWATSDGATGSGTPFFHRFGAAGSYTATCTATDAGTSLPGQSPPATIIVGLPPGTGGPYPLFTLAPCRVVDTRGPAGPHGAPAIQPAGTADRTFNVTSAGCAIPADARAISVNVTATNVKATGTASLYRGDGARNGTSTASLIAGKTRANNAILQLALDGSGTIKVQNTSGGTFDLIVDVNGYFR